MRDLQQKMKDPLLFAMWTAITNDDCFSCYLQLYRFAKEGKLIKHDMFTKISETLADTVKRESSENLKMKHGIRYTEPYMHWAFMMRGHGQFSAQNYGIMKRTLPLPSFRTLR